MYPFLTTYVWSHCFSLSFPTLTNSHTVQCRLARHANVPAVSIDRSFMREWQWPTAHVKGHLHGHCDRRLFVQVIRHHGPSVQLCDGFRTSIDGLKLDSWQANGSRLLCYADCLWRVKEMSVREVWREMDDWCRTWWWEWLVIMVFQSQSLFSLSEFVIRLQNWMTTYSELFLKICSVRDMGIPFTMSSRHLFTNKQ